MRTGARWSTICRNPERVLDMLEALIAAFPALLETYAEARKLIDAYPTSDGARVLREMLEIGDEARVTAPGFPDTLMTEQAALRAQFPHLPVRVTDYEASELLPAAPDIRTATLPDPALTYTGGIYNAAWELADIHTRINHQDGLVYIRARVELSQGGQGALLYGADGPVKVWVNGKEAGCVPDASNPATAGEYRAPATWQAGENTLVFALNTNKGNAWGVIAQAVVERSSGSGSSR